MSAVGIGCKAVMVVRIAVKRMCWANVPTKWRNEHQATDFLIHAYWITVPGECKQCHQINTMSNMQESTPMLLTVCQCVNNSATNQKDFLWLTKGIFFLRHRTFCISTFNQSNAGIFDFFAHFVICSICVFTNQDRWINLSCNQLDTWNSHSFLFVISPPACEDFCPLVRFRVTLNDESQNCLLLFFVQNVSQSRQYAPKLTVESCPLMKECGKNGCCTMLKFRLF